jgi:hypothetical protein
MLQLLMLGQNIQRCVSSVIERFHSGDKELFSADEFGEGLRRRRCLSVPLIYCFATLLLKIADRIGQPLAIFTVAIPIWVVDRVFAFIAVLESEGHVNSY